MKGRQPRAKMNIPMCCAGVLLCLTLFSFYFTGGLYARYITRAEGADSARVITFGDLTLTETGDFNAEGRLMIIPGVDLTKKAVVDFEGSEASTCVFIEVTTGADWSTADNLSFTAAGGKLRWALDGAVWKYHTTNGNTRVYYHALTPNDVFTKDLIADEGKITVSADLTAAELNALSDMNIGFRATVVQSGGFASVQEAWNSIKAKEG